MRSKKPASSVFRCWKRFVRITITLKRTRPSAQASDMVKAHNHLLHPIHTEVTASSLTARVMEEPNLPPHQLLHQGLQAHQALVAQGQITVHNTLSTTVARIHMLHMVGIRIM